MPFLLLAGLSLAGSAIGAIGSSSAASKQADASKYSADIQKQMFDQLVKNEAPFVSGGQNALSAMLGGLGLGEGGGGLGTGVLNKPFTIQDFQESPGFQFQKQQGEQAIMDQASALGDIGGGNTLKALDQFGTGLANQDWWNAYNAYIGRQNQMFSQLGDISQLGEAAGSNQATGASAFGQNIGQAIQAGGNAQAGGILGATSAIGGGLSSIGQNYLLYNMLGGGAASASAIPEITSGYGAVSPIDTSGWGANLAPPLTLPWAG